jgi:hypothetical protein
VADDAKRFSKRFFPFALGKLAFLNEFDTAN